MRVQRSTEAGFVSSHAQKWLHGVQALLVSKSFFESNVLEIILDRNLVNLCTIPGILYMTQQKWEVYWHNDVHLAL